MGGDWWRGVASVALLEMGDWSKDKGSEKMYSRDPLETEHASQRRQLGR